MTNLQDAPTLAPGTPSIARDPFALELIKNALVALADEMALTIYRTARSFVVKEALDFSTALFLADGQLIAQGTCLPFHLGAMPFAVKAVMRAYEGRILPGDLFITNDPYDGSTHLPDIVLVKPIFHEGALIGYSVALAHMTDIGGRIPGGNASDSTEIYQEGLRIPASRFWREGEPDETMERLIEKNVRVPDKVLGDIRSLVAACVVGEREMVKLAQRYGAAEFEQYCRDLLDYTERFTRAEIAKLPKGTWRFLDYLDGDGVDPDPIPIAAAVTIREDSMTIDLTGSAPQVRGAINCVYPFTLSTALACVRSIVDLAIPNNAGYFRPDRGDRPGGHGRESAHARGGGSARHHRHPHRRRDLRRARAGRAGRAARVRLECARCRHLVWRSRRARRVARVSRVPARVVGRRSRSRRHGRVHRHARQLLQRAGGDDRGRPAHRRGALCAGAGLGRTRSIPRRPRSRASPALQGQPRDAADPFRSARPPALRSRRRGVRRTLGRVDAARRRARGASVRRSSSPPSTTATCCACASPEAAATAIRSFAIRKPCSRTWSRRR